MSATVRPTSGAVPSSSLNLPDIQRASFSEECKVADSPQELTQIVRFNKPSPHTALNSQPPLILAGHVCVSSSTVYLTSTQTTVVTTQSSHCTSSNPVEGALSLEGQNVHVSEHTTWPLALVSSSSTSSSVPVQCEVSLPLTVTQNIQSDSTSHHTLTQSINPLISLTPGETSQEKLVSAPLVSIDSKSTIYTESYGHIRGYYPRSMSQPLATVVTATPPLMAISPLPMRRETLSQSKLVEGEENLQLNTVAEIGRTTYQVQGQTLPNMEEKNSQDIVAQQTISPLPLLQYAIPRSLTISTHSPNSVIQSDPLSTFSSKGAMTSTKEHFQVSGAYPLTESELHIPVTSIPLGEAQGTVVGPQHYTMATSQALSSALQMSTCQPISSSSVKQYSAGDNAHFISMLPSSRGSVVLNEVSETSLEQESHLVTKTESQIPISSTIVPYEGTPIRSDLLYMPKPRELVPVQSAVAGLHYHSTHQGQTIPSFAGGSIPNTIPALSRALSSSLPPPQLDTTTMYASPNPTAVAIQMSTPQPFLVSHFSNSHTLPCDRDPVFSANNPANKQRDDLVDVAKPVTLVTPMSIHPRKIPAHMSTLKPEAHTAIAGMQCLTAQTSSNVEENRLLITELPQTRSLSQSGVAMVTQHQQQTHLVITDHCNPVSSSHTVVPVISDGEHAAGHEYCLTSINPEEAGEAFREYRGVLLEAITDPLRLANYLYAKKIISKGALEHISSLLTKCEKNFNLLDAVESRIRTHPSDFLTLLAILENDSHLCVFAEGIKNSYCELFDGIHV